jgi:hypothetical protein
MGKCHGQLGASSTAPALDGSRGAVEHGRRFIDRPSLDIDEEDGIALIRGKGCERRGDGDLILALP